MARKHTNGTFGSAPRRANDGGRCRKLLMLMAAGASRLSVFFYSMRQHLHQARGRRAEVWLEAMQNAEAVRKERRARRRSLGLLMRLLNPEQRQEFVEHGYFHVTGASSRTRYRIRMESIANIDVLTDDGRIRHRLCVYPAGGVPLYDVMASQLLQLQDPVAEGLLLQQANVAPPPARRRLH